MLLLFAMACFPRVTTFTALDSADVYPSSRPLESGYTTGPRVEKEACTSKHPLPGDPAVSVAALIAAAEASGSGHAYDALVDLVVERSTTYQTTRRGYGNGSETHPISVCWKVSAVGAYAQAEVEVTK